jgi:nucleoside 2-deoxyribosyltransferase
MTPVIYCSGPLFCPEEQGGMAALAGAVEAAGYATFLPQRDGLEAYLLRFVDSPLRRGPLAARIDGAIFALDAYQIVERCEALVFNMNGRVPDEGGVAEAALAYAVGRPVVIYKNDRRSTFGGRDNPMVTSLSARPPVADVRDLPRALRQLLREADAGRSALPRRLEAAVGLGRHIWSVMQRAPAALKDRSSRALVAEIAALCAGPVSAAGRRPRGR